MASPPSAVKPYTTAKESHDELDAMEHFLERLQPGEDNEPMLKRLSLTPEPPSVREIEMAQDMKQQQQQIAMLLQQVAELTAVKRDKDTETKPKTQTETQKETQKEIQTETQKQLHVELHELHVDSETKRSHQFKNVQEQIREGFDLDEKPKPLRLIASIGVAHKQPLLPTGRQAIRNELTGINHMSQADPGQVVNSPLRRTTNYNGWLRHARSEYLTEFKAFEKAACTGGPTLRAETKRMLSTLSTRQPCCLQDIRKRSRYSSPS
jgi:hypothetical protein